MDLLRREFYFLRHGATDWNLEGRCMGQKDLPLNTLGKQQAFDKAILLQDVQFSTICYSSLQRAADTAKIIANCHSANLYEIHELKERYYASFEGMLKSDIKNIRLKLGAEYLPNDAESSGQLQDRVIVGINRALEHPGPVLVVSHGGVFKCLMEIINLDYAELIGNCVAVKIVPNGNMFSIIWV